MKQGLDMYKPDYNYLMKLDNWSKKDAALIICGLEPDRYRHIRFSYKDLDFEKYPELVPAYKLHKIFLSINFYRHGDYQGNPIAYVVECKKREWPVPEELLNLARERYAKEKDLSSSNIETEQCKESGQKEKDYLLKTLGVLAMLYVSKQKNPRLGDIKNTNISQVVDDVLQFLEDYKFKSYGLGKSSLNRRIAEGLKEVRQDH